MSSNYSLYSIPVAYFLSFMPHVVAMLKYKTATKKKIDMINPRTFIATVSANPALDSRSKNRILRAEAASANGFENMSLFAAGVVAGNVALVARNAGSLNGASGGDQTFDLAYWLNRLTATWLALRFVYNHVYIYQDLVPQPFRPLVYFSSLGCIMAMFVLAGNEIRGMGI
jgi:uncharacterized MAPEG superfamily protein